ncbi:MAG: TetR/AcrR family transcriptional regulator [Lacisediminihabitans sp.]
MPDSAEKTLRQGSTLKRAAILDAARELFLADGFDRTSVDAIAAHAGVSKRTVYDYFGDKQTLLREVVMSAGAALMGSVQAAIDEHLGQFAELDAALVAFAESVVGTTMDSPDYAALIRLVTAEAAQLTDLIASFGDEPEDALARRFAELDAEGVLIAPKPRLAADHFVALTFQFSTGGSLGARPLHSRQHIEDGVAAFLRAYTRAS